MMDKINPWEFRESLTVQEACALAVGDDPTSEQPNSETKALALAVRESLSFQDIKAYETLFDLADEMCPGTSGHVGRKAAVIKAVMAVPLERILSMQISRDEWVLWFAMRDSHPQFLFPRGKPTEQEMDSWYATRGDATRVADYPGKEFRIEKNEIKDSKTRNVPTYCTPMMQLMFDAVEKFWEGVDPKGRGAPKKSEVNAFLKRELVKRGIRNLGRENNMTESIATIIRHEESPSGMQGGSTH